MRFFLSFRAFQTGSLQPELEGVVGKQKKGFSYKGEIEGAWKGMWENRKGFPYKKLEGAWRRCGKTERLLIQDARRSLNEGEGDVGRQNGAWTRCWKTERSLNEMWENRKGIWSNGAFLGLSWWRGAFFVSFCCCIFASDVQHFVDPRRVTHLQPPPPHQLMRRAWLNHAHHPPPPAWVLKQIAELSLSRSGTPWWV